jgi:Protein of unknown function (DUF3485)
MYRTILTVSAGLVLVASGVVHGLWTDRWTADPAELKHAADLLAQVPLTIGKWDGKDLETENDARLGLAAVMARRYAHLESGKVVTIYLACGRPGPICVHTPDVCYTSDGYDEVDRPRRTSVAESGKMPAEFWTARYMRQRPDGQTNLRIFWAWHTSTGWQVADNPRVAFAGEKVVHKLYVLRELANPNEPAEGDACAEFMQELLPALEQRLFVRSE